MPVDATGVGLGAVGAILDFVNQKAANDALEYANKQRLDLEREQWYSKILTDQIARGAPYVWDQSVVPGATSFKNGTPVFMPYYTGEDELGLYSNAKGIYDTTMKNWGGSEGLLKKNTAAAEQFRPLMGQGKGFVGDLFSGKRTQQRLGQFQPVANARIGTAAAQRQAINTNLQQRLNALEAQQANRGFVGGSTFDRNAMYRAALPDYQQAAVAMANANLANAEDVNRIQNEDWNMAFQNINLPAQMAQQYVAFENLPSSEAVAAYNNLMGVYTPFALKQWTPPARNQIPQITPTGSDWGAAAGTASNLLKDYQDYRNQQEAINMWKDMIQNEQDLRKAQYSWMYPTTSTATNQQLAPDPNEGYFYP